MMRHSRNPHRRLAAVAAVVAANLLVVPFEAAPQAKADPGVNCATVVSQHPSAPVTQVTTSGDIASALLGVAGGSILCIPSGSYTASGGAINLQPGAIIVAESDTTVTRSSANSPLLRLNADDVVYGGTWDANGVQAAFRSVDGVSGIQVVSAVVTNAVYGIQFVNSASGTLTNITTKDNSQSGVLINTGAQVTVNGLLTTNNGANGLRLDQASGTSALNNITAEGNQGTAGIAIVGSSATMSGSTSRDNIAHGLLVSDSTVQIESSTISANALYGVQVTGSTITIDGSDLSDNVKRGLQLGSSTKATVTRATISRNGPDTLLWCDPTVATTCDGQGIGMSGNSSLTLASSTLAENGNNGVYVGDGSQATLTSNVFSANKYHSVEAKGAGAVVTLADGNRIVDSGKSSGLATVSGIGVYGGGRAVIAGAGNVISGSTSNGVTAQDNSTIQIDAPFESSSNAGNGIAAYGTASIVGSGAVTVANNTGSGLYANGSAAISLTGPCAATGNQNGAYYYTSPASIASTCPRFLEIVLTPDMTGDGRADIVAIDWDGKLILFPQKPGGNPYPLDSGITIGTGFRNWNLVAPGDFNGDGFADLIGRNTVTGELALFPGKLNGVRAAVAIGKGWAQYRLIAPGDLNNDGNPDLLGISPDGKLYFYPGDGHGGFSASKIQVGKGWSDFTLLPAGDFDGDGNVDILGIGPEGNLYFYPGLGSGYFGSRQKVGHGWSGFEASSGVDFTGDGIPDMIGRSPERVLYLYAGQSPLGFATRVKIGVGW